MKLEIVKIGGVKALILPDELADRLGLNDGDTVLVTEAAGGFSVSRVGPAFDEVMAIADKVMEEYSETLKTLAQ
jgi:putative addiction module antidote